MSRAADLYAGPLGAAYSAYMEREWLGRPLGRLLWGGDSGPYYENMAAIGEVPAGGTIVDCPCGAGPALRALSPDAEVRYIAADLSPAMLARARRRAAARGLGEIKFLQADAADLPLADDSVDLFLSNWGIHCYPDPQAAVREIGRVLAPGGRLVGATFVQGEGLRQRLQLRPNTGGFGALCTEAQLLAWLTSSGLEVRRITRSGIYLFFDALGTGP